MSREFRLGVFIVATLLILAAGVFIIGDKELLFRSTYSVKTEFHNVVGLDKGADVRVGGIHKGTVKRIDLPRQPDGKVTVVMNLDSSTRNIVKKDSLASIKSEGLLGDKYIEISFGSDDAEKLKNWDTIGSEPPLEAFSRSADMKIKPSLRSTRSLDCPRSPLSRSSIMMQNNFSTNRTQPSSKAKRS